MLYQDKATRVFANILTRCYQIRAETDQIFCKPGKTISQRIPVYSYVTTNLHANLC